MWFEKNGYLSEGQNSNKQMRKGTDTMQIIPDQVQQY